MSSEESEIEWLRKAVQSRNDLIETLQKNAKEFDEIHARSMALVDRYALELDRTINMLQELRASLDDESSPEKTQHNGHIFMNDQYIGPVRNIKIQRDDEQLT